MATVLDAAPVLRGRDAECAALNELLAVAAGGRSAVLVLRGGPGLGKTALLERVARRADGLRVLRATGSEAEAGLPFAGLHQLLFGILDRVASLPDPQAAALRSALGLAAGPVPGRLLLGAAVLVDDGQWLDAASLAALAFAAPCSGCWPRRRPSVLRHTHAGAAGAIAALIGAHLYLVARLGTTAPPWIRADTSHDRSV